MTGGPNAFCWRHRCFLRACRAFRRPNSASAKEAPAGLPPRNRPTTPSSSWPLVTIQLECANRPERPERMDRPGYPPIPLEPAEVTHRPPTRGSIMPRTPPRSGRSPHLTREACTRCYQRYLTTTPPLGGKYSFRASVDHAQIGSMAGCRPHRRRTLPQDQQPARSGRRRGQEETACPTITNFKLPLPSPTRILPQRCFRPCTAKKFVRPRHRTGLSHDGKKLLYTRSIQRPAPTAPCSTILIPVNLWIYAWPGAAAFWSPDDGRIVFPSKLWIAPGRSGRSCRPSRIGPAFSPQPVNALHGWVDNHTILAQTC